MFYRNWFFRYYLFYEIFCILCLDRGIMVNYSINEFKGGLKIMLDGEFCNILENEYVKLGKG